MVYFSFQGCISPTSAKENNRHSCTGSLIKTQLQPLRCLSPPHGPVTVFIMLVQKGTTSWCDQFIEALPRNVIHENGWSDRQRNASSGLVIRNRPSIQKKNVRKQICVCLYLRLKPMSWKTVHWYFPLLLLLSPHLLEISFPAPSALCSSPFTKPDTSNSSNFYSQKGNESQTLWCHLPAHFFALFPSLRPGERDQRIPE